MQDSPGQAHELLRCISSRFVPRPLATNGSPLSGRRRLEESSPDPERLASRNRILAVAHIVAESKNQDLRQIKTSSSSLEINITKTVRRVCMTSIWVLFLLQGATGSSESFVHRHETTIMLNPRVQWMKSSVWIAQGQRVTIEASGAISTLPGSSGSMYGPDGGSYPCNADCTLPSGKFGQLLGRVGESTKIIVIGSQHSFVSDSTGLLFLAVNDCCNWSDNAGSYSVSIAVEDCVPRYYVSFVARKGLPGHAFVMWLKVDPTKRISSPEAFGMYPRQSSSKREMLFGAVPSEIRDEYVGGGGVSGDVELSVEVTAEQFRKSQEVRSEWERRTSSGEISYDLHLQNCIDFTDKVARVLREAGSSIEIPVSGGQKNSFPYAYLSALFNLNRSRHVSAFDFGEACP